MTQENKERYLDACPELLDAVLAVEEELGNEPCFDWNQEWKDVQRIVKELPVDMEGWAKGVQGHGPEKNFRQVSGRWHRHERR